MAKKEEKPVKNTSQTKKTTSSKKNTAAEQGKAHKTQSKKNTAATQNKKKTETAQKKTHETHHESPKEESNKNIIYVGVGIAIIFVLAFIGVIYFLSQGMPTSNSTTQENTSAMNADIVATVNEEEVTSEQVNQILLQYQNQGRNISQTQALDQAVITTLLRQKVEEQGYLLSQEEIEEQISGQLQRSNMTIEEFKSQVESSGRNYSQVIEDYSYQFAIEEYFSEKIGGDVNVSETELRSFYDRYTQQVQGEAMPYEQVKEQLRQSLVQRKTQQLRNQFIQELVQNATVEYNN